MKQKCHALLSYIYHRGEIAPSQLDQGDRHRLQSLFQSGDVVESRSGAWSGEKYYCLAVKHQRRLYEWFNPGRKWSRG